MGLLGQAHAARVTLVIGNSACANRRGYSSTLPDE